MAGCGMKGDSSHCPWTRNVEAMRTHGLPKVGTGLLVSSNRMSDDYRHWAFDGVKVAVVVRMKLEIGKVCLKWGPVAHQQT